MFIQSLRLHDFRSYHQVLLTPPAGVTVFVGENGAGKTNLLEAVHLCCLGRSHRTAFDREMIRAGQETAAVQVRVQRADGGASGDALSGARRNGSRQGGFGTARVLPRPLGLYYGRRRRPSGGSPEKEFQPVY